MTQKEICDEARTNWISRILIVLSLFSMAIGILVFFYGLTHDFIMEQSIATAIVLIVSSVFLWGFAVIVRAAYLYIFTQENFIQYNV